MHDWPALRPSVSAAEAVEPAAVAFGGLDLAKCFEMWRGTALFRQLAAEFLARVGFLVERLRSGGGAADLAQNKNLDLIFGGLGLHLQQVAGVELAGGFSGITIALDAPELTGMGG